MKKIFYSLIFILFLVLSRGKVIKGESPNFFNVTSRSTNKQADKVKCISSSIYCFEKNNTIFLHMERDYIINEGNLIDISFDDDYIYIIGCEKKQNLLLIYEKQTKKIDKIVLSASIICDVYVDDYIYIVGGYLDDTYISKYSKKGVLIDTKCYGGSGYEIFTSIRCYGDYLFIGGDKDALSPNSCFGNLGNKGEKKALLVRMNKDLEMDKQFYINNHDSKEVISSLLIKDEIVSFVLLTNKQIIQYKLDIELTLLECFNLPNYYDSVIEIPCLGSQTASLYLVKKHTSFFLVYYSNNKKVCEEEVASNQLIHDYIIDKGHFNLFGIDKEIVITDITQFTIIKNEPIYCTKAYYEDVNNYHFEYLSLFEELNFGLEKITPFFEKTKCGTYDAIYAAECLDGTVKRITTKIIVDNFVNIIDQGIYKEGYVLEFFGNATLDGKTIYYGEELRGEGQHVLEITDINNKTYRYQFSIFNDYQKDIEYKQVSNCISVSPNNPAKVELFFNQAIDVKNLYINNQEYSDYNINENIIEIMFNNDEKNPIKNYYINKIITTTNQEIIVNKNITVKAIKDPPELILTKGVNDKCLSINCKINDNDNTFLYLLVNFYNNEDLVKTKYVYNSQKDSSDKNITYNRLEILFCYELGDGTIYKKEIAAACFNSIYEEELQINFTIDELKLNDIDIFLTFPKELSDIKNIKVAGKNVDNINIYKKNTTFNSVIYASTIIMLGIFLLIIILLRRKYKNKIRVY